MKYNPEFHNAVISNYRLAFQQKYHRECKLIDKRIWEITDDYVGLEGGTKAEEEAILEQMAEEG